MDDELDRLIDTLLREALANERPPNLARRILSQVDAERRKRMVKIYWITSAAVAATVLIGLLIWQVSTPAKPPDVVKKDPPKQEVPPIPTPSEYASLARGAGIETKDQPQKIQLGGYVKLEAAVNTSLQSEGKEKAEQVFLKRGQVVCEVDHNVGTFIVRTDGGTVSVNGTKFNVQAIGEGGERSEYGRSVEVSVKEGSVTVNGLEGLTHIALAGGESGGVTTGVVTRGTDAGPVEIRTVGDKEPRRYTPQMRENHFEASTLAAMKELRIGDRVQVAWKLQELRRVTAMKVVQRAHRDDKEKTEREHGKATGRVTEKDPNNEWVRIQVENSNERYMPRWNADTKALDREMRAKIGELSPGDIVKFEWINEEHRRITKIEKEK
jgi:hypothetical protein